MRYLVIASVLVQALWFDPSIREYYPTICSYIGRSPSTYQILIFLLPVVGIAVCIGIWKSQSWAWAMAKLLSNFVLFQALVYWMAGYLKPIGLFQILAASICCVAFYIAEVTRTVCRRDVIALIGAIIVSIPIIYFKYQYFPVASIEYNWPIPRGLYIWDYSNLSGVKSVFLWWFLFGAIVAMYWVVSRTLKDTNAKQQV